MAPEKAPERKLAVLLHADVVGSTKLVQQNEATAHARITDAFQRFSTTIKIYGGTVHEVRGDALVAEMQRASDAVTAAIAFQFTNAQSNEQHDDHIVPEVRVGISLGEVVIADDTVTGPGIVLAQRVEQLAAPGGVCVTAAVHEAIPGRMPFDYKDLGEQSAKGFDDPIRVYAVTLRPNDSVPEPDAPKASERKQNRRLIASTAIVLLIAVFGALAWLQPWQPEFEPARPDKMAFALSDKPSIAVLPFDNMSGDPEQEYFADGMTDDLINGLSRISGLTVISRNSSFTFKGRSIRIADVGRELGVRHVLEGSVRRQGQRVRINVQLVDASDETQIWSARYDQDLTDVFALQDEVTRTLVDALAVRLTSAEQSALAERKPANPKAYDLLLKGNELYLRFNASENLAARELYLSAIEAEPGFARAHVNLALTYSSSVFFNWAAEPELAIQRGLEAAERAMALDDRLPQLYFARSNLFLILKRHADAVAASRRAVELNPSYADGHGMLTQSLLYSGELEEARISLARAKRLNPRFSYVYLWMEGHILFMEGRYAEALPVLDEMVLRNPNFDSGRLLLAATQGHLGNKEEAEWEVEEVRNMRPDLSASAEQMQSLYKRRMESERYFSGLAKAGLTE